MKRRDFLKQVTLAALAFHSAKPSNARPALDDRKGSSLKTDPHAQSRFRVVAGSLNNQMCITDSYPEYWVDGKPFFQYSGTFLYYRLPFDRWAEEMLSLKAMGLNTIDVIPMWNWHEPEEGKFDFDGHTNPRRNLKAVFALADALCLKITLRPGPYNTNEWRNGGYPGWLLSRPEYRMAEQIILEGGAPRWSALQYIKSEESTIEWLKNKTHLEYTQKYYREVLGVAGPHFAGRGGPILSLQMDDDPASNSENYNGPNFWKYINTLRSFAEQATDGEPLLYFLDAEFMRLNAECNYITPRPFWNQGQDYSYNVREGSSTLVEAAKNKFLLEILKTQPLFIPGQIEFQAGWWPAIDDTFPRQVDPSNTLMATRVMFQNGIKALNYFPPNDTLNPSGWSVSWSNHFYMWDAALNLLGQETGRAVHVRRNGRLVAGMGPLLSTSHLLADAGIVYPMATFPQKELTFEEAHRVEDMAKRLIWAGAYDHRSFELVDSDFTPPENFLRYQVLFAPNMVNGEPDKKLFPHLENYSEKAQQTLADYTDAGGTLIVFPSLPRGIVFDHLLAPFRSDRQKLGDASLTFRNGTTGTALEFHSVLTIPELTGPHVNVFARDAEGGIVGARVARGKGQIVFLGADFSTWTLPRVQPADGSAVRPPGIRPTAPSVEDYSEEIQRAASRLLPALLNELGRARKVYPETKTGNARDVGLYVTELVADGGSQAFEQRADGNGYGFVGVTNFSLDEHRTADIQLTDPRAKNLNPGPENSLRLPSLTLPPRESLLLPIRVPLDNAYAECAPGLDPADEIYFATVEVTRVIYDGENLKFEVTAPADGEVALRLSRRPAMAKLDGHTVEIGKDALGKFYFIRIERGQSPNYERSLELQYPRQSGAPGLEMAAEAVWIAGETARVQIRVQNPGDTKLECELAFSAGSLYNRKHDRTPIAIAARAQREYSFAVTVPGDTPANLPVDLVATLLAKGSEKVWTWQSQVTVRRPFDFGVEPPATFPLREDVQFPIVHPTLASLQLPGTLTLKVKVKNWRDRAQAVTITAAGDDLKFGAGRTELPLGAGEEATFDMQATPQSGSGIYRFVIALDSGKYHSSEEVFVAAIAPGEAIAYTLDYDRDGFPDVILENSSLRLFVSPNDGGRAYACVNKTTGTNAFNSVGGMRDNFIRRILPEYQVDEYSHLDWLGLFNRPYTYRIVSAAGQKAMVRLEYFAPDIYPRGVRVERTLTLDGPASHYVEENALTPQGVAEPQSYVLENSITFKVPYEAQNFRNWFAPGLGSQEFLPEQTVELPGSSFLAIEDKHAVETFALIAVSPALKGELVVHAHAATVRLIYPGFKEAGRTSTYQAAYFFGRATHQELEDLQTRLRDLHSVTHG